MHAVRNTIDPHCNRMPQFGLGVVPAHVVIDCPYLADPTVESAGSVGRVDTRPSGH